jgi:hypothetical protein
VFWQRCQVSLRLQAAATGSPQPGWDFESYPEVTAGTPAYTGPRVYLYSGHDTDLAAFLSGMRLFDGCAPKVAMQCSRIPVFPYSTVCNARKNPPFASSIVFELLRESGDLYVTVHYHRGSSTVHSRLHQILFKGVLCTVRISVQDPMRLCCSMTHLC